jgi:hypothetical protein
VATRTNNYRRLVEKISQRHRLCFKLSGLKRFKREAGEKPPRGVRKRVRVTTYKPKESRLSSKKIRLSKL